MKIKGLIGILLLWTFSHSTHALEFEGIHVPDVETIGETKLPLNGVGLRSATIFKIRVYIVMFYYPNKVTSEDELLSKPQKFIIKLKFLRDLSKEKIIDSLNSGFAKNSVDLKAYSQSWKLLSQGMEHQSKGDEVIFTYLGDKLIIKSKAKEIIIDQIDFVPQLLKLWFGAPPNEDLKKGLLSS